MGGISAYQIINLKQINTINKIIYFIPFVTMVISMFGVTDSCDFSQITAFCLFKLPPVCKQCPGLPSNSIAGFKRRSAKLLNENSTIAPHSTKNVVLFLVRFKMVPDVQINLSPSRSVRSIHCQ